MQVYADVIGCTIQVAESSQTCALGSAISAAVLAGAHRSFADAQQAMTSIKPRRYYPIPANQQVYDKLYYLYRDLHDSFGGVNQATNLKNVMKDLIEIKQSERH